jgi:hypothetical protein
MHCRNGVGAAPNRERRALYHKFTVFVKIFCGNMPMFSVKPALVHRFRLDPRFERRRAAVRRRLAAKAQVLKKKRSNKI